MDSAPPSSSAPPSLPPAPAASTLRRSPWPVRIGLALVLAVYLTYSSFGVAHPVLWGHYGHHAAEYMQRARMTLRFHMLTPATAPGFEPPHKDTYYFHHPIGYHHILVLTSLVFGDTEWVAAGTTALLGLTTLWALFALAARFWSREWALLAVAIYVGLPILTSFSILTDPMLPTMACSLLLCRAFLEYLEAPSRKWLGLGCLAIVLGGLLMWELYFQAFFYGLFALALLLGRRGRALRLGRWNASLAWLLLTGAVATATMAFHFLVMWRAGMVEDFLASYRLRHSADPGWVIGRHKQWLEILYGWPLIRLGFLWLGLFALRTLLGKARARDQAVLLYCVLNVFYIYLFAQGSSVHLYRVFFFSSFFALGVMDLVWELGRVVTWALARGRLARLERPLHHAAVTLAAAAYFAVETPHAYANLLESRVVMGTHGHPGYNADYPKLLFAREVARLTAPTDYVFAHNNIPRRVEFSFYADRSQRSFGSLAEVPMLQRERPRSVVLTDRDPSPFERPILRRLVAEHPTYIFDHYALIDLRRKGPELHEYQFVPEEPSWRWRWFVSHRYPPMRAKELTTPYGQCLLVAARLRPSPAALDGPEPPWGRGAEVLCHHDVLVLGGRPERAADYRARLGQQLAGRAGRWGSAGEILGLRSVSRQGAELWLVVDRPPRDAQLGWRLEPLGGAGPLVTGEGPLHPVGEEMLAALPPGFLYAERIAWSAPPGRYRLVVELLPPRPAVGPAGPPLATAELGEIEVR